MGDLNGHIGLDGKRVNVNGQMILKFAGNKLKVKKLGTGKFNDMAREAV